MEYLAPSSPAEQDYLAKLLPALKRELNPDLENALYLAGQFHQRNSIVQPAIMAQNLFLDIKPTGDECPVETRLSLSVAIST